MPRTVYELQGYAIVLEHVIFVTRVFEAEGREGFQFNVRLTGDARLSPRFATRHDADLARKLLVDQLQTG